MSTNVQGNHESRPVRLSATIAPYMMDGRADLSSILEKDYINSLSPNLHSRLRLSYHVGVIAKYNIEKLARCPR